MIVSSRLLAVSGGVVTLFAASPQTPQPLPGFEQRAVLLYSRHSRDTDGSPSTPRDIEEADEASAIVAAESQTTFRRTHAGDTSSRSESVRSERPPARQHQSRQLQSQCPTQGSKNCNVPRGQVANLTTTIACSGAPLVSPSPAVLPVLGCSSNGESNDDDDISSEDDLTIEGDLSDVHGEKLAGKSVTCRENTTYQAVPAELWREEAEDGSPTTFDFDLAFSFLHAQFLELRRTDQRLAGQLVALRRAIAHAAKTYGSRNGRAAVGGGGRSPRRSFSQRCRDVD